MYSRYGNDPKRPVRLPEHYSGSAFSQRPTEPVTVSKREAAKPFLRGGVEEKASPTADRLLHADTIDQATDDLSANTAFTTDATVATNSAFTTDTANTNFISNAAGTANSAFATDTAGTANTNFISNAAGTANFAFATDSSRTANTTVTAGASGEGDEREKKTSSSLSQKLFGTSPLNFSGLRRLLGGEGEEDHDRLLLLGLILLLSRTEGDSDILLWLSLLLLCG